MTDHWNSENRPSFGDRDLQTVEMDPHGAAQAQSKRLGRYEIVAELGWGAMGLVYKAYDPRIDRIAAIKIISISTPGMKETQAYRARFIREARAAGRLSHPGIVTIYDVDRDPDSDTPYIVMEYVPGKRLDTFVADLPSQRLALEMSLALAQQIAEALDYAHSQGIVHRDIKPGNVIVTAEGRAKIADFGIAKINQTEFTLPGQVLGTPAFMAPEQLLEGTVDGRSDLFSLGVILYWMLTGTKPFSGESATSAAFKLAYRDPVPATEINPSLPPHFDAVLRRALAKAPGARYQTGREFALDLKLLGERKAPRASEATSVGAKTARRAHVVSRSLFCVLRSLFLALGSALSALKPKFLALSSITQLLLSEITKRLQPLLTRKTQKRVRGWELKWFAIGAMLVLITALGLRFAIGRRAAASPHPANSSSTAMQPIADPVVEPPAPSPVIEVHEIELPNFEPVDADSKPAPDRTTERPSAGKHGGAKPVPVKNPAPAAHKPAPVSAAEMVGKPEAVASNTPDAIPEPKAPATLLTIGEHPFRSAALSISVDGKLASEEQLTGTRKLHFGSARGIISEAIRIAPGSHVVEVHVVSERDHSDQTQTIEGKFQENEVKKLEIKFVAHVLQLSWK